MGLFSLVFVYFLGLSSGLGRYYFFISGCYRARLGGLEDKGCCFLSFVVVCLFIVYRGREVGLRVLEVSRVRRE